MDVGDHCDPHRRRTIPRALLLVLGAGAWVLAVLVLLRSTVPPLERVPVTPSEVLAPDTLDRAVSFRAGARWLSIASVGAQLLVLSVLAWKGKALAARTGRLARGRIRAAAVVAASCCAAVWLAGLVPAAVELRRGRAAALVVQGYAGWLADRALELVLLVVVTVVAVAVALALARRFGARWWLPFAFCLAALGVAVLLLRPVVLEPLVGHTRPLSDGELATRIAELGERLGVEVGTVEVSDASSRTTVPNAWVSGLGPTRRVVLDDTLLDGRLDRDAVAVVAAHELAHVARAHLWKGAAWWALLVGPGTWLLASLLRRLGDLRRPDAAAAVPAALLCVFALFLLTLPAQNAISRRYEAEADWLALVATGDGAAAVRVEQALAREALIDPDPPAWAVVLRGTHPSPVRRLEMAEAFSRR